ncbi:cell division protein ZipA [Thiopseudomonas acetoxidans]|uniref:Cell division protein ZipA n=1 Tax=Thiopseudomonas acetoxidans TaxID=3041622 RepID=A0ABT7SNG3_9GAMM|nr:cell division protein ZipA [Thiopseudomonas sp. CY1220]MDM7857728.1 cell division protein ZipA [Thiopseudomonas sp. CY1220]
MDMGLREWLVICGLVVVLLVILDSVRRHFGRNSLKFKLDRKLINQFSEDVDNPEIVGPVRVAKNKAAKEKTVKEPYLGVPDSTIDDAMREYEERQANLYIDEPIQASQDAFEFADDEPEVSDTPVEFEEILVVYVESFDEAGFHGQDLLQCLLESGLRFGEMDIFHRHETMSGKGAKLFSMANALNPGVFDLDNMDDFSTRAVCFFMSLPGPKQPKQAFDLMLNAARKLANDLGGELKDDHRSVLTTQTIDLFRQRITDFERRNMLLK